MITEVEQTDFFKVIRERRSVRTYDPSDREIKEILSEAILAPSSSNLQPWRFLVIHEQAIKEKLLPIANNQRQVAEASVVIAILGDMDAYKQAETIFSRAVEAGHMPADVKEVMVERTVAAYGSFDEATARKIVLVDGGLVAMQLMLVARAKGYDTVPMGGYNAGLFKQEFNVPERYEPVMLVALGKASAPGRPTARLTVDEVTTWNTF
jgi:nitroreductase